MSRYRISLWALTMALTLGQAESAQAGHGWRGRWPTSHSRQASDYRTPRLPWRAGSGGYWTDGPAALERRARRRRSAAAKAAFRRDHPCPSTGRSVGACPGYVIDHVIALKRGGADSPSNMQWQTIAAAKAKDSVE